jgi:hypothetical protein
MKNIRFVHEMLPKYEIMLSIIKFFSMKTVIFSLLTICATAATAQIKYDAVYFNQLTEIKGTEYVIATFENHGKMVEKRESYLLFINAKNGQSKQIDFPQDAILGNVEQIKIDDLGIHKLLVTAHTVNLGNSKTIGWYDPTQLFIISTDGQQKVQLTENQFFVRKWEVNRQAGTIVVVGHYDTNGNGKYDKLDKNEILIYDLKTCKLIAKI